ncbi:hypothetical protein [Arcobacter porcinus]|uniref:Uncharacterized protein n=1 Tax=Arcobacter porcinus TaxID=1935204 RepID=A0ABX2YF48_9BACT|nr:hypothetical protein [Arcobacter porcinus]OCL89865.1 hypothetical protein AAX27_01680 [Aliarcobacter thereius]OCL82983.1 hypothetical protein AAW30_01052 [Arcobacter porcinus]OCL84389.1 hypothetical protein AAW29_00053 [Arcobacter porcinus]OCL88929.1 hypothetical protein AAX30_00053 [Arcobacter porcinus]OCL93629.1 hypothetical protein AAX28_01180 [Arcobacter porcinus]
MKKILNLSFLLLALFFQGFLNKVKPTIQLNIGVMCANGIHVK